MSSSTDVTRLALSVLAAFDRECRELGLRARLDVQDGRLTPVFEAQFGAEPAWLSRTFLEELRARGVGAEDAWFGAREFEDEHASRLESLRAALRRTRARLVDTDSWVSGGHAWPFPVEDPLVRARALATYRAPACAPAAIDMHAGRVALSIPAGDCGAVVSAGIWVPTLLAGDFEVTVPYALPEWDAGEREACLGLFAVAPDGTFRLYAQRVARARDPAYAIADVEGSPGPARAECTGAEGSLRIARDRGLLTAWHLRDGAWAWLGRLREPTPRALLVGIKIWATGRTGSLRAELTGFRLACTPAPEQTPPPPARPDPRHAL